MSMPKTTSSQLPQVVMNRYSEFDFREADAFYWSAADQTVYYDPDRLDTNSGLYTLIHELGHALHGHKTFTSGAQLLKYEVDAWEKAKEVANEFGITIDAEHIETCLDTYRDWLHRRSLCPTCKAVSTEVDENTYRCFNCAQHWSVPVDQRARCYRLKLGGTKKNAS